MVQVGFHFPVVALFLTRKNLKHIPAGSLLNLNALQCGQIEQIEALIHKYNPRKQCTDNVFVISLIYLPSQL